MTPTVCLCGRVAEEQDVECSLCGRELTGLRPARPAPTQPGQRYEPPPAQPDYRSGYPIAASALQHPVDPVDAYAGLYRDPVAPATQIRQPAPPAEWEDWTTVRGGVMSAPQNVPVKQRKPWSRVVVISLVALIMIVAGFTFGYFALARFLVR